MKFIYSDALLELLVKAKLLNAKQARFITLEKGKQRQKLLKQFGRKDEIDPNFPDLLDVIVSYNLVAGGSGDKVLDEETIMRAVSRAFKLPFKKLDPLELDMNVVTKTIPKNFAIRQLILPFNIHDGILEVASYHPDCKTVISDIEQANQMQVRTHVATKSEIKKIISEFFGFQSSISAAEDHFTTPGVATSVDIGNLEQYVKPSNFNSPTEYSDEFLIILVSFSA